MSRTPRVKPRHAKRRPSRVIVPLVLALVVLVAGGLAYPWWPRRAVMPTVPDAAAVPTTATINQGTTTATNVTDVLSRLASCQARVRAADRVIAAAKPGAKHWSQHVGAQFEADAGRITVPQLDEVFSQTRVLAPADLSSYDDAVLAYNRIPGPCTGITATGKIKTELKACSARALAQEPVLSAADRVLKDWGTHSASMTRSEQERVANAAEIWIEQYRAAPVNIDAWNEAVQGYDPPTC